MTHAGDGAPTPPRPHARQTQDGRPSADSWADRRRHRRRRRPSPATSGRRRRRQRDEDHRPAMPQSARRRGGSTGVWLLRARAPRPDDATRARPRRATLSTAPGGHLKNWCPLARVDRLLATHLTTRGGRLHHRCGAIPPGAFQSADAPGAITGKAVDSTTGVVRYRPQPASTMVLYLGSLPFCISEAGLNVDEPHADAAPPTLASRNSRNLE